MTRYEKPILNIVELEVKESVAALVPKTIYKKQSEGSTFSSPTVVTDSEIQELESYATSNQTT